MPPEDATRMMKEVFAIWKEWDLACGLATRLYSCFLYDIRHLSLDGARWAYRLPRHIANAKLVGPA